MSAPLAKELFVAGGFCDGASLLHPANKMMERKKAIIWVGKVFNFTYFVLIIYNML
ncbi:hypothetical protein AQPE_0630 [Aquipluma nitroreducens]|uniref:Uncharacterized protein n=1 Tax=Aquipluma nitroreducens TaxID=2010828 RepID=A0A5K7S4J5_9BACT|nr:hypothetical protein AQPE_0630 [Aquipluma nitroreducens]